MSESLGKAVLDLEANLAPFEKNMQSGERTADNMKDALDAIARVAIVAEIELNKVKMDVAQGVRSREVADTIERSVGRVGKAAIEAADHLGKVKIDAANAAETTASADVIDRKLKDITGNANEARRSLESVSLAGAAGGGGGGGFAFPGGGMGALIGGGALLAPAAGPGALGLLASIPVFAAAGAGALGTLALAFDGVGKAIAGNKKAFDNLVPAQQQFVLTIRSLDGAFDRLKQTAAAALFPGLTAGLKAALSPGTLNAITQAVTEFGHAIGAAAQQWGQYFGSDQFRSIFGPLMAQGARSLGEMSQAALSLFDALGILARAAIPFTEWLTSSIAAGAQWFDTWMHAKDATGGLSGAMNEAQRSLTLVWNLFVALSRAVYELGAALYPVSKIAVKDLTDGLNWLAGVLDRNKQTIQDIVGGALQALVDIVKVATPIVGGLAKVLNDVAHAVGGWRVAFDLILGGLLLAKLAGIAQGFLAIKLEVSALGLAIDALPLAGIVIPIVLDITYRKQISDAISRAADWVIKGLGGNTDPAGAPTYQQWQKSKGSARLAIESAMKSHGINDPTMLPGGPAAGPASKTAGGWQGVNLGGLANSEYRKMTAAAAASYGIPESMFLAQINQESGFNPNAKSKAGALGIAQFMPGTAKGYGINPLDPKQALPAAAKMMSGLYAKYGSWELALAAYNAGEGTVDRYLAGKQALPAETTNYVKSIMGASSSLPPAGSGGGSSPFGTVPPWSSGLGPKPPKPAVIPAAATAFQGAARIAASQASALGNTGETAQDFLEAEMHDYWKAASLIEAKLATVKQGSKVATTLTSALDGIVAKVVRIRAEIQSAIVVTGDALLPDALKAKLTVLTMKFKADSTYAQSLTGTAAEDFRGVLLGDITGQTTILQRETAVLKAKLEDASGKQKAAIKTELTKVTTQLRAAQEQVVQTLQGTVSTLQSRVGTSFQAIVTSLDAEFQAATQQLVDALGAKFFQNGLLTPAEQRLVDFQKAQTQEQLQQALTDATKAYNDALGASLVWDASTGLTTANVNNPALIAAQKQLDAANDAITQDKLQTAATAERTAADQQYAESVKLLQATRAQTEAEMNRQLALLADAFQNGTGSMEDLRRVAGEYGLQITAEMIPEFDRLASFTSSLIDAFSALAAYISKITGTPVHVPAGTTITAGGWTGKVDANQVPISAGFYGFDANGNWVGGDINSIDIPKLDTGGTVMKTGLAVVHRGEDYLGVGANRRDVGGIVVNVSVPGGFVGNEAELAQKIGTVLQRANMRGIRFDIA